MAVATVFNLLLNTTLIPPFGWHGAVIATNASSLFAAVSTLIIGMKLFPVPLLKEASTSMHNILFLPKVALRLIPKK